MKRITTLLLAPALLVLAACPDSKQTTESRDAKAVQRQQSQYSIGQPIPAYDWSLERQLVIELYNIRNRAVVTHSVWRGEMSVIEGDCPSYGYGLPFDTSLTNPLVASDLSQSGNEHHYGQGGSSLTSIEQAEPNGIFASKNTTATWVFCLGEAGSLEPIYVESKVTAYPGPVIVNYETNRVTRSGAATVLISVSDAPAAPAPPSVQ